MAFASFAAIGLTLEIADISLNFVPYQLARSFRDVIVCGLNSTAHADALKDLLKTSEAKRAGEGLGFGPYVHLIHCAGNPLLVRPGDYKPQAFMFGFNLQN